MQVEIIDGGSTIASAEVPGRLLIPSNFPLIQAGRGAEVGRRRFLSTVRSDLQSGIDHLAGDIAIPYVESGRVATYDLFIPPPRPFTESSLKVMWSAIADLGLGIPQSVDLQGRVETKGRRWRSEHPEIFSRLEEVKRSGDRLLTDWPSHDTSLITWRPIDLSGGREDERETLRGAKEGMVADGKVMPDRTARRIGTRSLWLSSAVSSASNQLLGECRRLLSPFDLEAVRAHLLTVSLVTRIARPSRRHVAEPPISSWPHLLSAYYRTVLLALSSLRVLGVTPGLVPLTAIWRLYEHWVAATALATTSALLGQPLNLDEGEGPLSTWWSAQWALDAGELHVIAQPTITTEAHKRAPVLSSLRSVSSDLNPDLVLAFQPTQGAPRFLIVDAKKRLGETMRANDAASAGSKYVWGLRLEGDLEAVPEAILGVILASPVPVQPMHEPDVAKINGALMTPTDSFDPEPVISRWLYKLGAC